MHGWAVAEKLEIGYHQTMRDIVDERLEFLLFNDTWSQEQSSEYPIQID